VTWATKAWIVIIAILFGITIFLFLAWYAVNSVHDDLKGIPKTFDDMDKEINWRKL